MFKFLFVAFFFFMLLMFLLGFSVVRTFKNILFGKGDSTKKGGQKRQTTSSNRRQNNSSTNQNYAAPRKKIIGEDEGEYVDYEEIKTSDSSR